MKKLLVIPLMIVLVSGLIFGGCAAPAPAPAPVAPGPGPTPSPTPGPAAPAPAAPVKPIELRIACFQGATAPYTVMFEEWGKKIEEETGGKVKFTMYAGQTLAKGRESYDATVTGVADLCQVITGYSAGRFTLSEVVLFPFMGFNSSAHAAQTLWDLWEQFPEMREQYKDTHVLWLCPASPRQFLCRTPVPHVEDIQGLKVRAPGMEALIVEALGATPVSMSGPDTYDSLEKGLLDVTFHPWEGAMSYRFYEVAKHFTNASVNMGGLFIAVMNLGTWNSLPDDVKAVIDKYSGRDTSIEHAKNTWDRTDLEYYSWLKENTDVTFYEWTADDVAKAIEMTRSVHENWIATEEAKGLPAGQIYEEALRILKKYQ